MFKDKAMFLLGFPYAQEHVIATFNFFLSPSLSLFLSISLYRGLSLHFLIWTVRDCSWTYGRGGELHEGGGGGEAQI